MDSSYVILAAVIKLFTNNGVPGLLGALITTLITQQIKPAEPNWLTY
jgi:hypothetical protein